MLVSFETSPVRRVKAPENKRVITTTPEKVEFVTFNPRTGATVEETVQVGFDEVCYSTLNLGC